MLKRTKPEPDGYALGEQLARFADHAEAALRGEGIQVPERCRSCAFRAGTAPNGCVTTVMDATKCMIEHIPFMCHHGKDADGEPTRPCAGFIAIMADAGPDAEPGTAPWPFSDEIEAPAPPPSTQSSDTRGRDETPAR